VDADHTDTGIHYGGYPAEENLPPLQPHERLEQLNRHVESLDKKGERNSLRRQMYLACREAMPKQSISACDSPVGSGKTFAVMAHLLAQAEKHSLRRIFVVLPYTNIIAQAVREYRKALVLPGENPAEVVAELHHRADFQSVEIRHLTALWRAPIIVTTAVAFFETMASKSTSTLRRLHELPGSAIFVDEAHAALPARLLPLAWKWMNIFGHEWGCYWVLASGSLSRFWKIPEIAQNMGEITVPEIIREDLRQRLASYEKKRIAYKSDLHPKTIGQMVEWLSEHPGPRLVILNTVQSAAVLAHALAGRFGRNQVEHLSTALTPEDREKILDRVRVRLTKKEDKDWTLVATSCVEAGVDLSFRTGFHELGSLVSLLQAAGRINREGI
jgi:CRISPR/Cas system-associated endonuclease/helicase Cas3